MPKKQKGTSPKEKNLGVNVKGKAVPAMVLEILGRVGTRGEAIQVRCKILEGMDKGKIMRRNVRGPIRPDDIIMLTETELEARALKGGRRR